MSGIISTVGDPLAQWVDAPGEWRETPLWGLADYVNGRAFKPAEFSACGLPVVKITELKYGMSDSTTRFSGEYDKRYLLKDGDLLFAWSGNPETSLDTFWWRGESALLNQHIFRVMPRTGIDKEWLYYLFKFLRPTFIRTARDKATSMGHVKVTDLKRLVACVPPLREQRAIAHILGTLDDKIELNRRMNETLEAMARAIFKSWFVDFDPVRAKAEGRDPGLPKTIADLFPDRFVDSELGEIPAGWEVGRLDSVLVLQRGFDLPATKRTSGQYPVLAASGPHGTHNEFMVRGPGLTTGRSGVLGKVFYVHNDFWPLNTSLWVKEFRRSKPAYAFHLLRALDLGLFNAGSAVPTLNRNHVHDLPTLLPATPIVDVFEEFAASALANQKHNADESQTLSALRDTLLPKLISGELRVGDAERFVGRHAAEAAP